MIAALLALAAAGCFTGPINREPTIMFLDPSAAPPRKHSKTYTVQATDPDGDRPKVVWDWVSGSCTPIAGPESWPLSKDSIEAMGDQSDTLMLDGTQTDTPFCLWAFAIDSHGAITPVQLAVEPQDQAPVPAIMVVAPNPAPNGLSYPLYSTIELSYKGSMDPDDQDLRVLRWNWTVVTPGGMQFTPSDCGDHDVCFTANDPGIYHVTLAATDPSGNMGTTTPQPITVNTDQPPCIQTTTPSYQLQTPIRYDWKMLAPSQISVDAVADDGDPYPSPATVSTLHFRWSVSANGGPFVPSGADFYLLPLASRLAGDLVKVRVEVVDRNPATARALFDCGDKDVCATVAGCPQRVSWSIEY